VAKRKHKVLAKASITKVDLGRSIAWEARKTKFLLELFGPPKIGKTWFAAGLHPDKKRCLPLSRRKRILFLAFEPGHGFIKAYRVPDPEETELEVIPDWAYYRGIVQALHRQAKKENAWDTIVVDTVDVAFKLCQTDVCDRFGMTHPQDEEYGKGWDLVADDFMKWIFRLCEGPWSVIFISHSKKDQITTLAGTRHKIVPTMSGTAHRIIDPLVDCIGYVGIDDFKEGGKYVEKRGILFEPNTDIETGDRAGIFPGLMRLDPVSFYEYVDAWEGGDDEEIDAPKRVVKKAVKKVVKRVSNQQA